MASPQKPAFKIGAAIIGTLILPLALTACAHNRNVTAAWRQPAIQADGRDVEWQAGPPQYTDRKQRLTVKAANNQTTLFLCIATQNRELIHTLKTAGLTVWLDPRGGQAKTFGIHLPGGGGPDHKTGGKPVPGGGALPPEGPPPDSTKPDGDPGQPMARKSRNPEYVNITYGHATGPLKMKMDEVRRTGIDIAVGQSRDNRMVYEFSIDFKSAPCLAALGPGMSLGIGLLSESAQPSHPGDRFPENGRLPGLVSEPEFISKSDSGAIQDPAPSTGFGPGGGMGGPGSGGPPQGHRGGGKGPSLKVWLHLKLETPDAP